MKRKQVAFLLVVVLWFKSPLRLGTSGRGMRGYPIYILGQVGRLYPLTPHTTRLTLRTTRLTLRTTRIRTLSHHHPSLEACPLDLLLALHRQVSLQALLSVVSVVSVVHHHHHHHHRVFLQVTW